MSKSRGKTHYQRVAAIIRKHYDEAEELAFGDEPTEVVFILQDLTRGLADCYEEEDPAFDREKFFQAALGRGSDVCPDART
jgi:hypothetical protein